MIKENIRQKFLTTPLTCINQNFYMIPYISFDLLSWWYTPMLHALTHIFLTLAKTTIYKYRSIWSCDFSLKAAERPIKFNHLYECLRFIAVLVLVLYSWFTKIYYRLIGFIFCRFVSSHGPIHPLIPHNIFHCVIRPSICIYMIGRRVLLQSRI